jgi:hypothetical protein
VLVSGFLVLFSAITVAWDSKNGLSASFHPTITTAVFFTLMWLPIVIQIFSIEGGSFKGGGVEMSVPGVASLDSLGWAYQKSEEEAAKTSSPQELRTLTQYRQEFAQELASRIPSQSERRRIVDVLAQQYNRVRAQMGPGQARTNQMESIVGQIRALAPQAGFSPNEVKAYLESNDPGERIVGLSLVEALPSAEHFEQVLLLIQSGKPFQQYHALLAMLQIVQSFHLDRTQKEQLRRVLETTDSIKKPGTDRNALRERLLSIL